MNMVVSVDFFLTMSSDQLAKEKTKNSFITSVFLLTYYFVLIIRHLTSNVGKLFPY